MEKCKIDSNVQSMLDSLGENERGVTNAEAKRLTAEGKVNGGLKKYSTTYGEIVFRNVVSFFNILLFALFAVLLVFEVRITNMFFMCVCFANILIGIIQNCRSKYVTDRLSLLAEGTIKILREGEIYSVRSTEIVENEVVLLETGYEIPADAVLLSGNIEVNEALLTGESCPVKKGVGDKLLAGTFVVSGAAFIRAEKVGRETYAAGIQKSAKNIKKNNSQILYSLNKIIKIISIIILPLEVLYVASQFVRNTSLFFSWQAWKTIVQSMAGSMISLIPAGMFLLTSVAFAVSVIRLSKKKVLAHEMYSTEMLARTDVLCFDKTGTLTDGTMDVNDIIPLGSYTREEAEGLIKNYVFSSTDKNQTAWALLKRFSSAEGCVKADKFFPFSSARKYSAAMFGSEVYILGAPDIIYRGKTADEEKILSDCASFQKSGMRVITIALAESAFTEDSLPEKVKPVALISLSDHIRGEVKPMLEWFGENGVETKIISGDNVDTVSAIAAQAGVPNAERSVSLFGLTDEEVKAAATEYTVFGRVSPEQKAIIVGALKENKKTVAISGDGVNDILAMKRADCSIAMGNGADAARSAADLVLLDNNFEVMQDIVKEGRRVVNNIQRSSTLFLMKTFFTFFLTVMSILMSFAGAPNAHYPFIPSNILLFEWIVIGLPSIFLALQPESRKIMGSFLRNILFLAIPAAICLAFSIVPIFIIKQFAFSDLSDGKVALLVEMISFTFAGGLTILFNVSRPFNKLRAVMCGTMLIIGVLVVLFLPLWLLGIGDRGDTITVWDLSLVNWIILICELILCNIVYFVAKKICSNVIPIE